MATEHSLNELLSRHRDELLAVAERYGATNLRLFGSVARGEATYESDIDLLVDLTRPWTLLDRIGMTQDLEDVLGRKVDLVVANSLRDLVRQQALAEAVPL